MEFQKAIQPLLQNEVFLFSSKHGIKNHRLTNKQKENNQITNAEDVKVHSNYNIWTGYHNIADVDLDSEETRELADDFLNPTGVEFGRSAHKGKSHRVYKVLDLDKKKHTRKAYTFRDSETENTIIELRAHGHYTMCGGEYDDPKDTVIFNKAGKVSEISWDQLHKQVAMLGVASIMLRKARISDPHNLFYKNMAGTLKQYKINFDDAEKIFDAVVAHHGHCKRSERMGQLKSVYKVEEKDQTGLPTIVKQWKWSENERDDFKKLLYVITGRHTLPKNAVKLIEKICYMMKQGKYWDFDDQEMYDREPVNVKYGKDFKHFTATKAFQSHPDRKVCKDFKYQPSKNPERYIEVKKSLYVNTYSPCDLIPNPKADTDLFWALVKHVIPHELYRNHFIDWFAFPMQQPGIKIRHAIILQSDAKQLGKGSLFDMQRDILGHHNTSKIDLGQALNRERGFLINKQTVLIDEAKASGRWSEKSMLVNTLKILISEYTAGTRELYKGYAEKDTCSNYWVNTNFRDAFPLEPHDPRYFVYFSPAKRNEKLITEYHQERRFGDLAAGVYAELLDRDLSKFNPEGVAPDSPYKDEMVKLADKPVRDRIREKFEQGVFPFDRDLVTTVELFGYFQNIARIKVTRENDIAEALRLIGATRIRSCPVTGVGKLCNIWVIRRHHAYKDKTAKQVGTNYKPFWDVKENRLKGT
tara:strand:+ start:114 stop:2207 length:2094 start_codon:yes stop_codon:yes gene_type:complete